MVGGEPKSSVKGGTRSTNQRDYSTAEIGRELTSKNFNLLTRVAGRQRRLVGVIGRHGECKASAIDGVECCTESGVREE